MTHLRIAPCSYQAAEYAVMNWHYSKRMPMPPLATFGVWEDGAFVGSVLFGRGATPNLSKSFGLSQTAISELVRVAMTTHKTSVTRVLSICFRELLRTSPGLRLLVSFADPAQGHAGKIYQAGNWFFIGETKPELMFLHEGRWKHRREITSGAFGVSRERKIDYKNLQTEITPAKFRYAYPLDDEMTRLIKTMALPYPKLSGEKGSPRGTTAGEGGSIPTSPHLFDLGVPQFKELPWASLRRLDLLSPEEERRDSAQIGLFA